MDTPGARDELGYAARFVAWSAGLAVHASGCEGCEKYQSGSAFSWTFESLRIGGSGRTGAESRPGGRRRIKMTGGGTGGLNDMEALAEFASGVWFRGGVCLGEDAVRIVSLDRPLVR